MDNSVDERFCALEGKIAYLDNDVAELTATLYRQQQAIDKLERALKKASEQLVGLGIEGDTSRDEPPPHY